MVLFRIAVITHLRNCKLPFLRIPVTVDYLICFNASVQLNNVYMGDLNSGFSD